VKDLIGYLLLIISALGALYAIGLIISYIKVPRDLNDIDYECYCDRCSK
jgi:hypothetical protein